GAQLPLGWQVHVELEVGAVAQALQPRVVGAGVGMVRPVVHRPAELDAAGEIPDALVRSTGVRRGGRRLLVLESAEHRVEGFFCARARPPAERESDSPAREEPAPHLHASAGPSSSCRTVKKSSLSGSPNPTFLAERTVRCRVSSPLRVDMSISVATQIPSICSSFFTSKYLSRSPFFTQCTLRTTTKLSLRTNSTDFS